MHIETVIIAVIVVLVPIGLDLFSFFIKFGHCNDTAIIYINQGNVYHCDCCTDRHWTYLFVLKS